MGPTACVFISKCVNYLKVRHWRDCSNYWGLVSATIHTAGLLEDIPRKM